MDTRLFVAEEPCKRLDIFLAEHLQIHIACIDGMLQDLMDMHGVI